jgi:hypothetical protein
MTAIARIEGYASIFNAPDLDGDVVAPGAFRRAIAKKGAKGVRMLYQHAPEAPIGRWTRLEEDSRGLWAEGEIILSAGAARDVYELIAGGAIDGLSIGYETRRAEHALGRRSGRRVVEADLWEVSIVTFPMAPGARVARVEGPSFRLADGESAGELPFADALRGAASILSA